MENRMLLPKQQWFTGIALHLGRQKQRARAKMRVIVADHLPSTNATITFTDSYPAYGSNR